MDRYFISYSSEDGLEFSMNLTERLESGPEPIPVWIAPRNLRPGPDWDEQIVEAIRTCKGLLFVMTEQSVKPKSVCKQEWVRALKYKKPVIPLRVNAGADLPFRLGSRHYEDFTYPFDDALDRLRGHLAWIETPEGIVFVMKDKLSDLKRELPRAEPHMQPRIQEEISELQQQIDAYQRMIDDPQGARRRTDKRIADGLERERHPEPVTTDERCGRFINPLPAAAPAWFQNRHVETGLIGEFLQDDALRLITVVGRAGIGKTAMVCRLLKSLESGCMPDDGDPLSVHGIVYLSAAGSHRVTLPHLYADLCQLLPESTARFLDAVYRNPQASTEAKMQALLEAFPEGRTVVLLDNFEDVMNTLTGEILDAELDEALRALLTLPQHGVKVIITTRVTPSTLQLLQPGRQMKLELDKGLESPFAENILRAMDRDGKAGIKDAPEELLAMARERTRGYPRALEALYAILAADRDTSLEEILNDTQRLLPENVVQVLVGEAFSRLDPLAQRVMQALALFGHPVPPTAVDYLLQPHQPDVDSTPILKRLVNLNLARREAGNYYLHHLDRAYAISRVPEGSTQDWQTSKDPVYSQTGLLHRGAEYFRMVRRDESDWQCMEDMSPLMAECDLLSASGDYEASLELLSLMLPSMERWGCYRQVERLAGKLAVKSEEPVRTIASGLMGWAYSALGEIPKAIEYLKTAIDGQPSEAVMETVISWRLELAQCYALMGEHDAAAEEYRRVIEDAHDDVQTHVSALLGLGAADEAHDLHEEAGQHYLKALNVCVPKFMVNISEDEEVTVSPGTLPPDTRLTTPEAWHPIGPLEPLPGSEHSGVLYLFGIEIPDEETEPEPPDTAPESPDAEEGQVTLIPVLIIPEMAAIWMSLAGLSARTDQLQLSEECCRLALALYGSLDNDLGVARALDLLRRIVAQVSDEVATEILTAQEETLRQARAKGHRLLEIAMLNDLAECYLSRSEADKAEALYTELSRFADELEDPALRVRADIGFARIDWFRGETDIAAAKLEKLLEGDLQDLQLKADILLMTARLELYRSHRDAAVKHALAASRDFAVLGSPLQQLEAERLLASIAIDQRDYDEAVRRLEESFQLVRSVGTPSLIASFLCDLARAYIRAGKRQQAIEAVNEAAKTASGIDLPSTEAEALMTIGDVCTELKKYDLAETAYSEAKEAFESIGDIHGQLDALNGLSWLYSYSENRDSQISNARLTWKIADELGDPSQMMTARMNLALALGDCGFHEEAIGHIEAIVAAYPSDALAIGNLGWLLYQAGHYDRSLQESRRALELDPTQKWVIRNLGHAYLAKGLPDDAEFEYRRAIKTRKGGEDFTETIREVEQLIEHKPDLPRGLEMLQILKAEQQKLESEEQIAEDEPPEQIQQTPDNTGDSGTT